MKVHQIQYRDRDLFLDWLTEEGIRDSSRLLIQLYTSSDQTGRIEELLELLRQRFPLAALIGCSTCGEILDGTITDREILLSFLVFESAEIRSFALRGSEHPDAYRLGQAMASALVGPDTKAMLVFASMFPDMEDFVSGLECQDPGVLLAGGLAGLTDGRTLLYTKEGMLTEGAVGVSLSGADLHASNAYMMNWQPIGKTFTVTRAEGNRVYTIDNRSVVELYEKYLGKEIARSIVVKSTKFPFLLERNGMDIGRDVLQVNEDGSVTLSGSLYEGEKVRLGFGAPDLILDNTKRLFGELESLPCQAVLVVSCEARRRFLYNSIQYEVEPLRQLGPSCGLFSRGEFFRHNRKNMILNHSMTLLLLSENLHPARSAPVKQVQVRHQMDWDGLEALKAMSHLAQASTRELEMLNQALEVSEQRYKSLIQYSPDIVYSLDISGAFLSLNQAFYEVLGYRDREVISVFQIVDSRDAELIGESMLQAFEGNSRTVEITLIRKDRTGLPFLVTKVPIVVNGAIVGVYGIAKNISERKEAEGRIAYMAYHDSLTDLPNRTLFFSCLSRMIQDRKASSALIAVMFLDLDDFKNINDTYGHFVGDRILQKVSSAMKRLVGPDGLVSRFGGDEFALALRVNAPRDAEEFAKRLIRFFGEPMLMQDGAKVLLTTSIGVSLYPGDGEDPEELLKNADLAMYKSKQTGKNGFQFFDWEFSERTREKRKLVLDLSKAVHERKLQVYYQPIFDLKTNRISGSEALVRWFHPERGPVPPSAFIPAAEENGLIDQIGYDVLRTACRQQKEWNDTLGETLAVSVNVSYRQFQRNDFVEVVADVLEETGLDPRRLHLEITESTALLNLEQTKQMLIRLQKLGVSISMDDFGTGYSSLGCIKDLSIDKLKIDRTFMTNISTNEREAAIVKTIIALSRNLNMRVLAEGVETGEQWEKLREYGCDEIQGFRFSPPVPAAEFEALVRATNQAPYGNEAL